MERIENKEFCANCKDGCCRHYGGSVIPSDLTKKSDREREFDVDLVLEHIYDPEFPMSVNGTMIPLPFFRAIPMYYLEYRMKNKKGEISGPLNCGNFEQRRFGKCVALGKNGCKLSIQDRPYNCAVHVCDLMADAIDIDVDDQYFDEDDFMYSWMTSHIQMVMRAVIQKIADREGYR
ncbi:MAG: hypothetical protein LBM09_01230 [Candidatus Nomurabacteria bacterium]|jgi:hypothetical protein|nr:hypothetical protein [Candidatus Nomurabacteria bacterium]